MIFLQTSICCTFAVLYSAYSQSNIAAWRWLSSTPACDGVIYTRLFWCPLRTVRFVSAVGSFASRLICHEPSQCTLLVRGLDDIRCQPISAVCICDVTDAPDGWSTIRHRLSLVVPGSGYRSGAGNDGNIHRTAVDSEPRRARRKDTVMAQLCRTKR